MNRLADFLCGTSEFLLPEKAGAHAMNLLLRLGVEHQGARTVPLSGKRAGQFLRRDAGWNEENVSPQTGAFFSPAPDEVAGSSGDNFGPPSGEDPRQTAAPTSNIAAAPGRGGDRDRAVKKAKKGRKCKGPWQIPPAGKALFCALPRKDEKRVIAAFREAGLPFAHRRRGLPHLFMRYRKRPGLLLGLVLFFFLIISSEHFIFDIRVTGNERLTDGEVLAMLEEEGVKIGSYLPSLDLDKICVQFARLHGEVSWISVNMMGTVAEVELREYAPGGQGQKDDASEEKDDAAGEKGEAPRSSKALVAARDGIVERCEVYGGTSLVGPMQVVRKGQLLISCVVQTDRRFKLEDAEGKVLAKTKRVLTVEVPGSEKVTLPKETEETVTGVEILGKRVDLPGSGKPVPPSHTTIREKQRFVLFGRLPLPIFTLKERTVRQEESTIYREGKALQEEADARMAALVEAELAEADILSSRREYVETGTGCRLTLTVECLENIARPLEVKSDLVIRPAGAGGAAGSPAGAARFSPDYQRS